MRHHRLMMLHHDHRLTRIHQPIQQTQQLLHIRQMQPRRRLVQHIHPTLSPCASPTSTAAAHHPTTSSTAGQDSDNPTPHPPTAPESHARQASAPHPHRRNPASATDIANTSLMSRPPNRYSNTDPSNRLPSHTSHTVATPAMIAQIHVHHTRPIAIRTRTLRIRTEQRRLHPVRPSRKPSESAPTNPCTSQDYSAANHESAPDPPTPHPHPPESTRAPANSYPNQQPPSPPPTHPTEHPHPHPQIVRRRTTNLQHTRRLPHHSFNTARSSKCRPVIVPLARNPATVPSKHTDPPAAPAAGPRSTT